jgi:hypothetical protein
VREREGEKVGFNLSSLEKFWRLSLGPKAFRHGRTKFFFREKTRNDVEGKNRRRRLRSGTEQQQLLLRLCDRLRALDGRAQDRTDKPIETKKIIKKIIPFA